MKTIILSKKNPTQVGGANYYRGGIKLNISYQYACARNLSAEGSKFTLEPLTSRSVTLS